MSEPIEPGRSRLSQRWNRLVHTNRAARWVDDWWFERGRIPSTVICTSMELGVYAVGLFLLPLPGFVVMTVARLTSMVNQMHTGLLAIKHRDLSLFNQPQTWERGLDGGKTRRTDLEDIPDTDNSQGNFALRVAKTLMGHASDFWTERRRMPGFVFGMASPLLAFGAGLVFHLPIAILAGMSYAAIALQSAPQIRNGFLSLMHRTLTYLDKPQTIPRSRRNRPAIATPEAAPGPQILSQPGVEREAPQSRRYQVPPVRLTPRQQIMTSRVPEPRLRPALPGRSLDL